MKPIGILYDNISGNTGDVAIGLSIKKILHDMGVEFDELIPGNFNPSDYDTILIGGGHLIRHSPDFFYDKFKVPGNHILNAVGILGSPDDLGYLNDYKYITVRSSWDKEKLSYLNKEVYVVPCTTMILEDLENIPVIPKDNSIGIHLLPNIFSEEEERQFREWISKLPFNIYFIPITHYNQDYIYMEKLSSKIDNSELLPLMNPLEIFTFIGGLDYFISCSLHGGIFSYRHNVPFVLFNYNEKMLYFMKDRGYEQYTFTNFEEMRLSFECLLKNSPNYSEMISRDLNALKEHTKNLQNILSSIKLYESKTNIHLTDASSTNYQIQNLQSQVRAYETQLQEASKQTVELKRAYETQLQEASKQTVELKRAYETQLQEASKQTAELNSQIRQLNSQVYMLENEITVMRQSIIWLLVMRYHNSVVDRALPCGTRRRRTYDLGLKGGRILLNDGWKHFWLAFSDYRKSKAISFKGINKDNAMPRPKMIPIESYMQKIDKTISIIIPTRDAGIEFEHTLEKLKNQKYIKEIEIIIVDSGSEDDTVKIAEKYTSKILKIKPEEFNHGETRNYGASKATGDYILFMVQDAIPIGNYLLYNMIRVLEIDENVAAVTCRQVPRSDADLFACNAIWNHYQYIEFNKNIVNYVDEDQINNLDFQNKRRLSGLDNVCSCIRRDVFHKFKFKRMNYAEDLDLGLRLVKEGYKLCFLFTSGVIHSHNRDQFYYLRRSYVDRKSLITISGEPPSEKYRNLDLLVNELLAIYNSLLYSLTLLNAVDNNEMRVDDSFLEIKNALYGGYHEGVSNSVVNREFHLMISDLGNMVEHTIKNDHIFYDDFISLMCSLQTYLTQRAQIYRVDDLIEPIFKIFATYCGSCLGCSYYYGSNDKRIQYIDQILTRGV